MILRYPETSLYWFIRHFHLSAIVIKLPIIRIIFYWFSPKTPILFFISPHKLFYFMNHQRDFYAHYHSAYNRVLCLSPLRCYRQPYIKNTSSRIGKTKRSTPSPLPSRYDGDTDIKRGTGQSKREAALPSPEGPLCTGSCIYFYPWRSNLSFFLHVHNKSNCSQLGQQISSSFQIKKKKES